MRDRELETFLQENIAGKWFCGFDICDKTPDHTVFTKQCRHLRLCDIILASNLLWVRIKQCYIDTI